MPNWCANRLIINAQPETIETLSQIIRGNVEITYQRAVIASQKLFLAGIGGILKPTETMVYLPYPALVQGIGSSTPENQAFTRWLQLLSDNVELMQERAEEILSLFEQSNIKNVVWGSIPKKKRMAMKVVFEQKRYDWSGFFTRVSLDYFWTQCDVLAKMPCYNVDFNMALIIPPLLAVEINGFNGGFLQHVARGYDDALCRYGTKWTRVDVDIIDCSNNTFVIDFDTAWSPSLEVTQCLSERYQCEVTHYYAESGCGYCGCTIFDNGEEVEQQADDLIFSEENDEGYTDIIGPDYILKNIGHYGG